MMTQVLDLYKQNAIPKDYIIGYRHIPLFAFIKNDIKIDLDLFDLDAYDVNDESVLIIAIISQTIGITKMN